jgi:hypothetical protein
MYLEWSHIKNEKSSMSLPSNLTGKIARGREK